MRALVLLPLAILAACSGGNDAPDPGAVTASEAKALDDAAAMLEERRLPEAALTTPTPSETASQPEQ